MFRTSVLAIALLALTSLTSVYAPTQTASFSQTISFDSVTVTVSGTFTVDTTTKTLSGTTSVTVVNSTSGATIASKTFSINLSFGTSDIVNFALEVPAASLKLAVSCTVTVATGAAICTVSRSSDLNGDGVVNIMDLIIAASAFGSVQGSPRFNPAADVNGDGVVNIFDISTIAAHFGQQFIT